MGNRYTITIEHDESGFTVRHDGKMAESLGWDELLGLVASLTIPTTPQCRYWMRTKAANDYFARKQYGAPEELLKSMSEAGMI